MEGISGEAASTRDEAGVGLKQTSLLVCAKGGRMDINSPHRCKPRRLHFEHTLGVRSKQLRKPIYICWVAPERGIHKFWISQENVICDVLRGITGGYRRAWQ